MNGLQAPKSLWWSWGKSSWGSNMFTSCILEPCLGLCACALLYSISLPPFSYLVIHDNEFGSKQDTVFDQISRMEFINYISNLFFSHITKSCSDLIHPFPGLCLQSRSFHFHKDPDGSWLIHQVLILTQDTRSSW